MELNAVWLAAAAAAGGIVSHVQSWASLLWGQTLGQIVCGVTLYDDLARAAAAALLREPRRVVVGPRTYTSFGCLGASHLRLLRETLNESQVMVLRTSRGVAVARVVPGLFSGSFAIRLVWLRGLFAMEQWLGDAVRLEHELCRENLGFTDGFFVDTLQGSRLSNVLARSYPQPNSSGPSTSEVTRRSGSLVGLLGDRGGEECLSLPGPSLPDRRMWLPPDVEGLLQVLQAWKESADWYASRELPWRYGVLLEGPPGTGKTKAAVEIAKRLRIPLYNVALSTFLDEDLLRLPDQLAHWSPKVLLFEDVDAVFDGRKSLHEGLSFEAFINTVGGARDLTASILVFTTNHAEKLDPAIVRDGRVDRRISLGPLPEEGRREIAERTLGDWPEEVANVLADSSLVTVAQFCRRCTDIAMDRKAAELASVALAATATLTNNSVVLE